MNRSGRWVMLGALVALLLAPFVTDTAGASTTNRASRQQRSCEDYIPRDLALNVTSAAPGQTVQITGLAYPGDTVTIRISQFGGPPVVLATAVAGPDGRFSASITIPANFPEGTYNITASSPNCPGVSTITIVVRFPGGRCEDRRTVQARRGDNVEWELLGRLDTTKPVTVTLVPVNGGPSVVVYTGPYPASSEVNFTVPSSLPNGRYRIVESGTGLNGRPISARCGRLVVRGGGGGGGSTTTTSTTTSTTSTTIPRTTTTKPGPTSTTTTSTTSTTTTTIPGGTCNTNPIEVLFDPKVKLIDFDGFNPKVEYTPVVSISLNPGNWTIPSAHSYDSYPNRINVTQGSEVWEIQFLDASGNVLATSAPTPDLPDRVDPGEWIGPLGTVQLPPGVVGVRAHHLPDLYPDGPDGPANSVFARGFQICRGAGGGGGSTTTTTKPTTTTTPQTTTTKPGGGGGGSTTTTTKPTTTTTPASTTTKPTTTTSTIPKTTTTAPRTTTTEDDDDDNGGGGGGTTSTTKPTTTTSTTAPTTSTTSTTVVTPTTAPVRVDNATVTQIGSTGTGSGVLGTSVTRSTSGGNGNAGLATTGSTVRPLIALATALIAVGTLLALGARHRRD